MSTNPMTLIDGYKLDHRRQYPAAPHQCANSSRRNQWCPYQNRSSRADTEQNDAQRRHDRLRHLGGEEAVFETAAGHELIDDLEVGDHGGEDPVDRGGVGGVVVGCRRGLRDGFQRDRVGVVAI